MSLHIPAGKETVDIERLEKQGWTVNWARGGSGALDLKRVYQYRELLFFLGWRDIKVKYRQMALGAAWTLLQPVTQMVLFSVLFGRFARLPSEGGVPYAVLVFSALVPWQYFASSLGRAVGSLVVDQDLLKKVAFPRLIVPLEALLPGLVDFGISFLVLLGLTWWFDLDLRWTLVLVPVFLLLAMTTSLAVGLWLSALNVTYRDVQYLVPFFLQAWMFVTPVAYSAALIPAGPLRVLYEMNPMAVVVKGIRWAVLGTQAPEAVNAIPCLLVGGVLLGGLFYFRRVESTFADVV